MLTTTLYILLLSFTNAFVPYKPISSASHSYNNACGSITGTCHSMASDNFFDNISKFFGNNDDGKNKEGNDSSEIVDAEILDLDDNELLMDYPGLSLIFRIPAKQIKLGGLRLYMFLYMMGQLNEPEPKSWKASQQDDDKLEMYYKDTSGALLIRILTTGKNNGVYVYRFGSPSPSLAYLTAESSVLMGILDELDSVVNDEEISPPDRLLILEDQSKNAIQVARESLSFS